MTTQDMSVPLKATDEEILSNHVMSFHDNNILPQKIDQAMSTDSDPGLVDTEEHAVGPLLSSDTTESPNVKNPVLNVALMTKTRSKKRPSIVMNDEVTKDLRDKYAAGVEVGKMMAKVKAMPSYMSNVKFELATGRMMTFMNRHAACPVVIIEAELDPRGNFDPTCHISMINCNLKQRLNVSLMRGVGADHARKV